MKKSLSTSHKDVITHFLVIPQIYLKIRKIKIKSVGVGRKMKAENLDVFEISVIPLLCLKMKENTDSRLT